jgi:hypothetical protein
MGNRFASLLLIVSASRLSSFFHIRYCPRLIVALAFRPAFADPSLRSGQALKVGATPDVRRLVQNGPRRRRESFSPPRVCGPSFFRLTSASRRDSLSRLSNSTADKLPVVRRREKARRSPRRATGWRGAVNKMYFSTTEASMLLKTHNRMCETKLRFAPKAAQNALENRNSDQICESKAAIRCVSRGLHGLQIEPRCGKGAYRRRPGAPPRPTICLGWQDIRSRHQTSGA